MIKMAHPVAGTMALTTVVVFWTSTVISELFASQAVITTVKTSIPWGFLVLIPALAAAVPQDSNSPPGVAPGW